MQTLYYIILIPMVYVAFAVFIFGTIARIVSMLRKPKNPSTLQIFPDQGGRLRRTLADTFFLPTIRRHNPVLWVFLMIFHICFLLLIIGHLELIDDFRILQVFEHDVFLGKGFIGLILCITLIYFFLRRLVTPNKDLSVPEDYILLMLLFLTVLFGAEMDWARAWYEYGELSVEDYREYLLSLVLFRPMLPETVLWAGHSFMLVLHVFFANLFLMFFPFSKIMHSFFSLPLNKLRRG